MILARGMSSALVVLAALAAGCSGASGQCAVQPPASAARADLFHNPVPIAVKFDQPGFSTVSDKGVYAGFDIDLSRYLATALGFAQDSFEDVLPGKRADALYSEKVKLVIATYSIAGDREKGTVQGQPAVDFAGPYMQTPDAMLVRKGSVYAKPNLSMAGARICVLNDTTTDPNFVRSFPPKAIPISSAQTFSECVRYLEQGSVDAVFTDELVLDGFAADTADYPGLVVEHTTYGSLNQYGIGLQHGQAAACRELQPIIEKFLDDNAWATSFAKNFPDVVKRDQNWQQDYMPDPNSIATTSYCQ